MQEMRKACEMLLAELPIRPMTQRLVLGLVLDEELTPATLVDFGIDSDLHRFALRALFPDLKWLYLRLRQQNTITGAALRQRIIKLDAALGYGDRLNALIKRYAPAVASIAHFHTSWDVIYQQ